MMTCASVLKLVVPVGSVEVLHAGAVPLGGANRMKYLPDERLRVNAPDEVVVVVVTVEGFVEVNGAEYT
ncbi:hypothetical protein HDC94_002515 [Leifsonia sp. AK011]|uniref:hypothetical protein n=1 Tax=Leifsonia sp. AK011 TaxID=2723075 RepID=UPI0015CD47B1|nr:hypothetical protein [Leifsonia sp. AK011]NYF11359.1 hypothetical protein [Leifsonia sp. AK011]